MKTDENVARDRAEKWKFVCVIPNGEHNEKIEVVANQDGISVDDYVTIPLEWLLHALALQYEGEQP
jgi:hypothetical protein